KGPQGPLYFVGATGMFLLLRRDWRFLVCWQHLAGIASFVVVLGLWQVPFFLALDWAEVEAVWSEGGMGHAHRLAYDSVWAVLWQLVRYPALIFGCMLPWSAMLVCYLGRSFRQSIGT